jgi:hypothetical protein
MVGVAVAVSVGAVLGAFVGVPIGVDPTAVSETASAKMCSSGWRPFTVAGNGGSVTLATVRPSCNGTEAENT